jgi:hypothetical protein
MAADEEFNEFYWPILSEEYDDGSFDLIDYVEEEIGSHTETEESLNYDLLYTLEFTKWLVLNGRLDVSVKLDPAILMSFAKECFSIFIINKVEESIDLDDLQDFRLSELYSFTNELTCAMLLDDMDYAQGAASQSLFGDVCKFLLVIKSRPKDTIDFSKLDLIKSKYFGDSNDMLYKVNECISELLSIINLDDKNSINGSEL